MRCLLHFYVNYITKSSIWHIFYSSRITYDQPSWLGIDTTKDSNSLHLFLKQPNSILRLKNAGLFSRLRWKSIFVGNNIVGEKTTPILKFLKWSIMIRPGSSLPDQGIFESPYHSTDGCWTIELFVCSTLKFA